MVSLNDINALTLVAKGYMLELGQTMIGEQKKGCMCCTGKLSLQVQQLILLVEQLYAKIDIEDYGDETSRLYACLLSAVANYSGANMSGTIITDDGIWHDFKIWDDGKIWID